MPGKNQFTAAEQQQISIATPGLFERSNAFNVDFENFREKEYSFPLPVGKATLENRAMPSRRCLMVMCAFPARQKIMVMLL